MLFKTAFATVSSTILQQPDSCKVTAKALAGIDVRTRTYSVTARIIIDTIMELEAHNAAQALAPQLHAKTGTHTGTGFYLFSDSCAAR